MRNIKIKIHTKSLYELLTEMTGVDVRSAVQLGGNGGLGNGLGCGRGGISSGRGFGYCETNNSAGNSFGGGEIYL